MYIYIYIHKILEACEKSEGQRLAGLRSAQLNGGSSRSRRRNHRHLPNCVLHIIFIVRAGGFLFFLRLPVIVSMSVSFRDDRLVT